VTQHDDFDIFEAPQPTSKRTLGTATWLSLIVAVAIIAFSIGLAAGTLSSRFSRVAQLPTPTVGATAIAVLGTPVAVVTATMATPSTVTPTVSVTPSPSPSPTAACSQPVDAAFADHYDAALLGCATAGAGVYWAAWEPFERGAMIWRSDTNQSLALFSNGRWSPLEQGWDGQEIPSRGEPPPGLQAPVRGFGYAWALRDDLFNQLGWARGEERGFCAAIQPFEHGFLLQSSTVEFCQDNLYNSAREPGWQPLQLAVLNDGSWRPAEPGAILPGATPPAVAVGAGSASRPEANGRFVAAALTPRLDAEFNEWPNNWSTVTALAQGPENYAGAADLSGQFQLAWSADGLYLALRIADDRYRSGPPGTDLWQGDGVELHLDRQLQADFTNTEADGDDYQVGVSFGPQRDAARGYRWLPAAEEGAFTPGSALRIDGEGYEAELFFPWVLFDMTSADLATRTFGFMLSLNDNDGDTPAQQSVLTTSAQRTTYNRPVEWGTLILAAN
jgi:hypothetical protein